MVNTLRVPRAQQSPEPRGIPVAPLTGSLDLRSPVQELAPGALRMRQNLQTIGQKNLRRGTGWQKLLSNSRYNNSDFHDQLLVFTNGVRQPITLIYEAESTRRVRSLLVGTQGTLAQLNEHSGNYRILGSGYGGVQNASAASPRFRAAQVLDTVVFTNNHESPLYYVLETGPIDNAPLLNEIPDLSLIGLSRAAVIWSWRNVLFLADVEMDSDRFSYRIVWSDFKNPLGFDPANLQSVTGFRDLFTHERILAGAPLGNSFLVYTTHGIWEMVVTGGEQSFDFIRRYNGEENPGASVLKYPNTLVGLPDAHLYMAEDGVYAYSPFYGKPDRLEWLHLSTPLIYDNIDANNCLAHVATYHANEVLISTASKDAPNQCPDRTLRVNMNYRAADVVDAGFTAFASYRSYTMPTIPVYSPPVSAAVIGQSKMTATVTS